MWGHRPLISGYTPEENDIIPLCPQQPLPATRALPSSLMECWQPNLAHDNRSLSLLRNVTAMLCPEDILVLCVHHPILCGFLPLLLLL